jgi:hypothetical protein
VPYLSLLEGLAEREGLAVLIDEGEVGGLVTWLERHGFDDTSRTERHSSIRQILLGVDDPATLAGLDLSIPRQLPLITGGTRRVGRYGVVG